jgi:hypothetical protein
MPIVNKANYVECPSCRKWMHKTTDMFDNAIDADLDGNRTVICQECYERADGSNETAMQKAMRDAVLGGVGLYKTEYVSPQQFDRGVIESSANSGAVGQAAEQGVQTHESQIPHIYAAQEFMWVYHQYCNCPRCRSVTSQAFNAQKQESARRLAEQAKPIDVPVARAKLEMPTADEVHGAFIEWYSHFETPYSAPVSDAWSRDVQLAMTSVLTKFVNRRNAKL